MSTFSSLSTALSGLTAARLGMDVVGQNIANAGTVGYTRQRVTTSAIAAAGGAGLFTAPLRAGEGVSVDGIARLGDTLLAAQVRTTASASGAASARAESILVLETSLREPGENGLSAHLDNFWAGWDDVANSPGEAGPAEVLLQRAQTVTDALATGYREAEAEWSRTRAALTATVSEVNATAERVAELNAAVRGGLARGTPVNELLDQRDVLAAELAEYVGATVRDNADGTIDVIVDGTALVSGDTARSLLVIGAQELADAEEEPVRVAWSHRPGDGVSVPGGEVAGFVEVLRPAAGGGVIAQAAETYSRLAEQLAAQVNAVHSAGVTPSGEPGGAFFVLPDGEPAALALRVAVAEPTGIATGTPGAGGADGSVADQIARLGESDDSVSAAWLSFVGELAATSQTAQQRASSAAGAATSSVSALVGQASVDIDAEAVDLMTYQTAYQAAARVLTAIDEALDVLINRTGVVGR